MLLYFFHTITRLQSFWFIVCKIGENGIRTGEISRPLLSGFFSFILIDQPGILPENPFGVGADFVFGDVGF